MPNDQIIIYQVSDSETTIDVQLTEDTVWLNQRQMAELFSKNTDTIGLHIRNIYKEGELEPGSTTEESSVVQEEAGRSVSRTIRRYNLDVIISVGYRVKSQRGTQFRIWANKVLKDYLVKGYSLNEKKLREQSEQHQSLKRAVALISNVLQNKEELSTDEATGLLKVVTDYSYALDILDKYDHQQLTIEGTTDQLSFVITYEEAMQAITDLKDKFGGSSLFGNEKDDSFKGSIGTIYQSFGGFEFYPTIEEKAANLLYFVVKNHSFSDGNKRIAAYLFVWFMEKNRMLYRENGSKRIADNALVALTLMIAESDPNEKDMMVKVVVNLINPNN
ncbi:virulence protein RhuM/Fic/DOC family protein [Mucilaginibacter kameinonensis]|uniref:virulence protein RhuM/Fic/DOC family protein n=1 Tax=Mucilaginibacter kameinonensis TaxID=452286 RepID=UPI000EF78FD0|nr:virulence protein RhuM/Fic/DOC family protein [Mucilaginibacter kameinonensis]